MLSKILLVGFLVVSSFFVIRMLAKGPFTYLRAVLSAVYGICALGVINILSVLTGVSITINYVTCLVAVLLSVPGALMLIILKLIL